jgi:hypothetical protein
MTGQEVDAMKLFLIIVGAIAAAWLLIAVIIPALSR